MGWREVLPRSAAWVREYDFYQPKYKYTYQANAMALRLDERDIAIVSPPVGATTDDFADIDTKGRVTALIAPNVGHVAGQAEWQARYPAAMPYAPSSVCTALKSVGRPFTPLSQLTAPRVEFRETHADTVVVVRHGDRPVAYLGELVLNGNALPIGRLVFYVTGRRPGLRINTVYRANIGPAVQTVARAILEALRDDPAIVPAHGEPLVRPGDASRVRALVAPLAR